MPRPAFSLVLDEQDRALLEKKARSTSSAHGEVLRARIILGCAEKGFRVPDDYSVCGFDNLSASHLWSVGLTSVEHHIEEKGRNAFNILYERMTGDSAPNNITRVEFTHHLMENRSTAPFHSSEKAQPLPPPENPS